MYLFVYGTLKQGYRFHQAIADGKFIEICTLKGLEMYDYGPYPVVIREKNSSIISEKYEITPEILKRIDRVEGYPSLYDRIEIIDSKGDTGWIYVAPEINSEKIKSTLPKITDGEWTKKF